MSVVRGLLVVLLSASLAACTHEGDDIQAWMDRQARDMVGEVEPLPAMRSFPVVAYRAASEPAPFDVARIEPSADGGDDGAGAPDMTRPREPLEAYPLESIEMVGLLRQGEREHALVRVDGRLYQVRVGDYMGQNHGLVTEVSEMRVKLNEIVENAAGEWVERTSRLLLQEQ